MKYLFLTFFCVFLLSCQNADIKYDYPENPENVRKQRAGKFFDDITVFDANQMSSQIKKTTKQPEKEKNFLWIAAIEVVGKLLPISAADADSGLIITQWYQDGQDKNKRLKINLLVIGKEINKKNLSLSIFKQTKNSKGDWMDERSADQNLTAQLIKAKIIERAKNMNISGKW